MGKEVSGNRQQGEIHEYIGRKKALEKTTRTNAWTNELTNSAQYASQGEYIQGFNLMIIGLNLIFKLRVFLDSSLVREREKLRDPDLNSL